MVQIDFLSDLSEGEKERRQLSLCDQMIYMLGSRHWSGPQCWRSAVMMG